MPLANQQFGELTTVSISKESSGHWIWLCKCSCGNTKPIREVHLRDGKSTSCGHCNHKELHPFAYKSWDSMKQRCLNPNSPDYARYGGRGITITKPWVLHFMNFYRDMGDPPTCSITGNRYTLNRKDNDGPYEKDNCNWASLTEQNNNRSNSLHPAIAELRIRRYGNR